MKKVLLIALLILLAFTSYVSATKDEPCEDVGFPIDEKKEIKIEKKIEKREEIIKKEEIKKEEIKKREEIKIHVEHKKRTS